MGYRIAVLGTGDSNVDQTVVPDGILEVASAEFEPVLRQVPNSEFPGTPDARARVAEAYYAAGVAAVEEGFDAVFINTMGDYGLQKLRDKVRVPVVGAGEAATHLALMLGNSFSVVSLWPPRLKFLFQHVLKDTGTEAHCKGLHFLTEDEDLETVGSEDNIITQLQACQYVPMKIIRDKCEQIFDEGEADTIILGCTCMAGMYPVLKADGLAVLEPMRAGYLATELLLRAGF
ncbi:MAG: hypothetical protein CBD74_08950 [Saprospirales bacterium TMED214]|nr:MAG: hypothetical protein CBD74_08950 [Saprospirales bacterium TMED214]